MRKLGIGMLVGVIALAGCTRESVRQALTNQQRADEIQQTIFDRQHDGLRVLAFRDLEAKLSAAGGPISAAQHAALNQAWNDRDLFEFWAIQQERSKAVRLAGVDAKLYADQSIVDLLIKQIEAGFDRGQQSLAGAVGAAASQAASQ